MDIRLKHIEALSGASSQSRTQQARSLYWINQLAKEDFEEVLCEDYRDHLMSLDLTICYHCTVPIQYDEVLCEDCKTVEDEMWRDHQEEVGNAHMVSVGRG